MVLFFLKKELDLGLGHLVDELFEVFSFLDPSGDLLPKCNGNIEGFCDVVFLPGQKSRLVDGTLPCTAAGWVAASLFRDGKGGLDEGFDFADIGQDAFSEGIG